MKRKPCELNNVSCPYCSKPLTAKSFELIWRCEHCGENLSYENYLKWKKGGKIDKK